MPSDLQTAPFVLAGALLVNAGLVGAWDIFALFSKQDLPTVSDILYGWGKDFPPFVAGLFFLLGHLFWPIRPRG